MVEKRVAKQAVLRVIMSGSFRNDGLFLKAHCQLSRWWQRSSLAVQFSRISRAERKSAGWMEG